jgi:alpha-beta hydrolase superfamily lysophospholipase
MKLEINHFKSPNRVHEHPILFVHGMAHAAWCWEWKFVPFFTEKGYDCYTISMRGHGMSEGKDKLRWHSISDYLEDLEFALNKIGDEPILIGHSMGGFIIQKYLLSGKKKIHAAILLSSVPANGMLKGSIKTARKFPLKFLKGNLTLSTAPFSETEYAVKTLCFSDDIDPKILTETRAHLQSESYRAYLDMLFLNLHQPKPTEVPTLFLHAENDFIVDKSHHEKTAMGFGGKFEEIKGITHDIMLDTKWEFAANYIHNWINKIE